METTTQTMTWVEAISKGYTHFIEEDGEIVRKFSSMKEDDLKYYQKKRCFLVDMESPLHYTIDAETIKELISDYVSGQEEMADEDDALGEIAGSHDYSKLAEELNEKFKKHTYYEPLDIEVTFQSEPFMNL